MFGFRRETKVRETKVIRGLVPSPEDMPVVYTTHRAWCSDKPIRMGMDGAIMAAINPVVHRCRIGKITLKQANG